MALLLLACLNVGALLLARTVARAEMLAIQVALGASRRRLACRLIVDASLLLTAALLVAVPVAWGISRWMASSVWTSTRALSLDATPDVTVLSLMVVLASACVIAITAPRLLHVAVSRFTIEGFGQRVSSFRAARWRRALTVSQVAASVVLLFCAALFWINLQRIRDVNTGFLADALIWTRLEPLPGTLRRDAPDAHLQPILEAMQAAGLGEAGYAVRFPTVDLSQGRSVVARRGGSPIETPAIFDVVSPGFFTAAGIDVLRGREFTWHDAPRQPHVAIVNASLASSLWGADDPIGQHILLGRPPSQRDATVVGVVADASPGDPRLMGVPMYFTALPQSPNLASTANLVVRHSGGPSFAERLQSVVAQASRHYPTRIEPVDAQLERLLVRDRLLASLSFVFALIGLTVSAIGIYALLAHAVAARTRELGVRMALGATRKRIVVSVGREGAWLMAIGVAAGTPLALGAGRAAQALLFGISPASVAVLGSAIGVIMLVGALAIAVPALRAARCNVPQALRHQ
jgi:predicted permease